jgi:hypothetical protein
MAAMFLGKSPNVPMEPCKHAAGNFNSQCTMGFAVKQLPYPMIWGR